MVINVLGGSGKDAAYASTLRAGNKLFALCKLPAPDNIADNFWRPCNIVAAVEIDTGVIERAIRGTGLEMEMTPTHPVTGLSIVGASMPDWPALIALAKTASLLFPAVKTQSWDIALDVTGRCYWK